VEENSAGAGPGADSVRGRRWLGDYLVAKGRISPEGVVRALRLQSEREQHEKLGAIMVKLGLVSERDVAEGLAEQLRIPFIHRSDMPARRTHTSEISLNFLRYSTCIVLDEDDEKLTLVMADPADHYVIEAVGLASGKRVAPCLGTPSDIEAALEEIYDDEPDSAAAAIGSLQFRDDVEQLAELAGEAPVIRLVNQLITEAAEYRASDIHLEPFEGQLKVRFRIDGLLREIDSRQTESASAVISRVKIMANLDIAERRLAQDGRFKFDVRGNTYDFRVSTVPTLHGESVVMRLLKRDPVALDFDALGFTPEQTAMMCDALAAPHGIVLVTGPTGSGKSTTLYAGLKYLNSPERMIITVEDPVEYNIAGINQIAVKPQIGLTFASVLKSIVRQDPDVIMIGEMRDSETAQIAVQSALTGHLVLSTLHTNDAPGSVIRMLDMGVQDYLLTTAVNLVQAQRLVRRLCAHCREAFEPDDDLIGHWGLLDSTAQAASGRMLYRARGCEACGNTGFAGRTVIVEMFAVSDAIRKLVLDRDDAGTIRRAALAEGMIPMRDDGCRKALAGLTTIEEVLRVTPENGS